MNERRPHNTAAWQGKGTLTAPMRMPHSVGREARTAASTASRAASMRKGREGASMQGYCGLTFDPHSASVCVVRQGSVAWHACAVCVTCALSWHGARTVCVNRIENCLE